jgi:hypothetical protein
MKDLLYFSSIDSGSQKVITQSAFQALVDATPDGGTLVFEDIVDVRGKPITRNLDITIQGNGLGQIRRAPGVTATTTTVINEVNGTTVDFDIDDNPSVNGVSNFNVDDKVLVVNPASNQYGENASWQNGQITAITPNGDDFTITVSVDSTSGINLMPAGSILIHAGPIISQSTSISFVLDGITIDGKRSSNDFTRDWRYNWSFSLDEGQIARNCHFKDTPCENIFISGALVEDCTISNLWGSFVHVSQPVLGTYPQTVIQRITGTGVCKAPFSDNQHNEAFVTNSNNTRNVRIIDCDIDAELTGHGAAYGPQGIDDFNIEATGNTWRNFFEPAKYINPSDPDRITDPVDTEQDTFINTPSSGITISGIEVNSTVGDNVVRVTFNEQIVQRDAISVSDFALNLQSRSISSMDFGDTYLDLILDASVTSGANGTLDYTKDVVTVNQKIMSKDGDVQQSFSAQTVVNNV